MDTGRSFVASFPDEPAETHDGSFYLSGVFLQSAGYPSAEHINPYRGVLLEEVIPSLALQKLDLSQQSNLVCQFHCLLSEFEHQREGGVSDYTIYLPIFF